MGQAAGTLEKVDDPTKSSDSKALDVLRFTVNGKTVTVDKDVDSNTRLAKYLRENLGLTGTKTMCWEGGCGACVVTLSTLDPTTGQKKISAVNSCLVPLLQCHEAEITTVEGLGDKKVGYHPVQSRLADLNGTQCGYCSPGMVMSMHSLLEKNQGEVSSKDVEEAIDGNLCRCTGYRPIMTAFKTFANDTPATDIEELGTKLCKKGTGPCTKSSCSGDCPPKNSLKVVLADGTWERPENLSDLLNLFSAMPSTTTYRLVAGNTGLGLFKNDGPFEVHIDISRIAELQQVSLSTPLTLGGAVTLTRMIEVMDSNGTTNPDYWYGPIIAEHVRKVAGTSIRNMATIAGNLMLKHKHPQFTSDIVVLLETVGATLSIRNETGTQTVLSVVDFLKTSMEKKIIVSINFFPISKDHIIRTFKVMPRANNARAYISAGFRIRVDPQDNFLVLANPSIVYGGINSSFIHAGVAESYLAGKFLGDQNVLQSVLQVLSDEIVPVEDPPNPDPAYLHNVALSLFYKFALAVVGDLADPTYRSGATALERGLATGQQTFDPDTSQGPLYKPIPKVEARAQTSDTKRVNDDDLAQILQAQAAKGKTFLTKGSPERGSQQRHSSKTKTEEERFQFLEQRIAELERKYAAAMGRIKQLEKANQAYVNMKELEKTIGARNSSVPDTLLKAEANLKRFITPSDLDMIKRIHKYSEMVTALIQFLFPEIDTVEDIKIKYLPLDKLDALCDFMEAYSATRSKNGVVFTKSKVCKIISSTIANKKQFTDNKAGETNSKHVSKSKNGGIKQKHFP